MVEYKVVFTKKSLADIPRLKSSKLDVKVKNLITVLKSNPFQNPPPYEKLKGALE